MQWKILSILLCILGLIGSLSISFSSNDYIKPVNSNTTVKVSGSFYVDNFSQIPQMIESTEFKNWIRSHNNINPDNFKLILVNQNTAEQNVIMYYNGTHKVFYSIKNVKGMNTKNVGNETNNSIQANLNSFRIVNNAGRSVDEIRIELYRSVGEVPILIKSSTRYNLPNGGVLNYNPSPELTHVTIGINIEKKWPEIQE